MTENLPISAQEQRDFAWLSAQPPEVQLALMTTLKGGHESFDGPFWTQLELSLRCWQALAAQPLATGAAWSEQLADQERAVKDRAAQLTSGSGAWLTHGGPRRWLSNHLDDQLQDWISLRRAAHKLAGHLTDPGLRLELLAEPGGRRSRQAMASLIEALGASRACASTANTTPPNSGGAHHRASAQPLILSATQRRLSGLLRELGAEPELSLSLEEFDEHDPHDYDAEHFKRAWFEGRPWHQDAPEAWLERWRTGCWNEAARLSRSTPAQWDEPAQTKAQAEAAHAWPATRVLEAELFPGVTLHRLTSERHSLGLRWPGAGGEHWISYEQEDDEEHSDLLRHVRNRINLRPEACELLSRAAHEVPEHLRAARRELALRWRTEAEPSKSQGQRL